MCLYVRKISLAEGRRLQQILRRDPNRIKVRRAQVVCPVRMVSSIRSVPAEQVAGFQC